MATLLTGSKGLAAASVVLAAIVTPAIASGPRPNVARTSAVHVNGGIVRRPQAVRTLPRYRFVERVVEVPALYENRTRRVWRDPVYETRRVKVEIPAKLVTREVPICDVYGRIVGYRKVQEIIEPARSIWRTERVLVHAGGYETVTERVLVRPASQKIVRDRVVVRARPRVVARPRHIAVRKARPAGWGIHVRVGD